MIVGAIVVRMKAFIPSDCRSRRQRRKEPTIRHHRLSRSTSPDRSVGCPQSRLSRDISCSPKRTSLARQGQWPSRRFRRGRPRRRRPQSRSHIPSCDAIIATGAATPGTAFEMIEPPSSSTNSTFTPREARSFAPSAAPCSPRTSSSCPKKSRTVRLGCLSSASNCSTASRIPNSENLSSIVPRPQMKPSFTTPEKASCSRIVLCSRNDGNDVLVRHEKDWLERHVRTGPAYTAGSAHPPSPSSARRVSLGRPRP